MKNVQFDKKTATQSKRSGLNETVFPKILFEEKRLSVSLAVLGPKTLSVSSQKIVYRYKKACILSSWKKMVDQWCY